MKIAGIHKNSFVDFPGKLAIIAFTPGCNMNCFYCHNRTLISGSSEEFIDTDDFFQLLTKRKGFIDGVVISGGEPTLQKDLEGFMEKVKSLGYAVKLDTNGTNPYAIENLIDKGLVDYIAMDVKAPFTKYNEVCCTNVDIESIKKSIEVLKNSAVDYEFRTTVAPGLEMDDIFEIAKGIAGARLYVLQKYRDVNGKATKDSHSPQFLLDAAVKIKGIVRQVETRGAAFCA
ncbi:anaerobic ribonucleoside-triphosphate reductase activating protein [Acetivibrio mesophilus]|uniref:Anaerobic ribonucleoside-triphosphate reductase activating protein n=1 Tax=Acetivibrio mesophilus TaxID=2487273 RepID=A0A4Q0I6V1_9FIRM|nr:anaerobic ribonucleoside-triphosphate reductase activating protein [Acetivibrio mesophilus]ODM25538.1 anaerobic ribonucleoside-triphosphate reductase activating protein [Clostridium sp. Bc-iso-3]RXE60123.1 anaerobic ribonucleoside-triphosphate reductase activating protein [Acetivibrio mesophilus]HHV29120.1 anaerobic ribonucleoside-triphosphate reductase activating protein [Clostridium sp.]